MNSGRMFFPPYPDNNYKWMIYIKNQQISLKTFQANQCAQTDAPDPGVPAPARRQEHEIEAAGVQGQARITRTRRRIDEVSVIRPLTLPAMVEPVTNGFGTVLAAEHDLLDTLHGLLAAENGRDDQCVARILAHQIGQLREIIALLEKREMLFPHPRRFDALNHRIVLLAHAANAFPRGAEQSLANLVMRNQNLRRSLGVLIGQSGHRDENETGLREAANRHGEMEWVLTVLLREPVTMHPTPGTTEGNWENEGGAS